MVFLGHGTLATERYLERTKLTQAYDFAVLKGIRNHVLQRHKTDVYAVLVALEDVIAEALQNGEIVRLGDLCTLQVSLSGKGAVTEEDHNASLIQRAKINFRPGRTLAGAISALNFTKVAVKYPKDASEEEDASGGEDTGESGMD